MFAAEAPGILPTNWTAQAVWDRLIQALGDFGQRAGAYSSAIEAAVATGGTLRPEVVEAYANWLRAAERLKQRAGSIVEGDPKLQAAIEASGVGFSGIGRVGDLEAYFAEVTSNAKRVIELLKEPIPLDVAGRALQGFGALEQVAGWAARFAGPLWKGLIQLLQTPTVKVVGATAVAAQGLDSVLNSETQAYYDAVESIKKLCVEGKLTAEQCSALEPKAPADWKGAVVWGGVLLGGLAIWLNRRKTALAGLGIRAKPRYKRNWRTS